MTEPRAEPSQPPVTSRKKVAPHLSIDSTATNELQSVRHVRETGTESVTNTVFEIL